ncbi:MAG: prepilin-type N-terminal cleavage/methylation domain-containing protein [Planctomycetota bacterium]|jgi:prepilin-type N-terminal cleavage/methylation domain-containing protein
MKATSKHAGFTLIEVILAMFLLLVGATTLLGMLSFGAGTARTANLRSDATAALPAVLMDLEETLFPLVVDEEGFDSAGIPIPERNDLEVPGYPDLSYGYRATPLSEPDAVRDLEYLIDVVISWREGGNRRSIDYQTILLREVPLGERLRQRFVERVEPLKQSEHEDMLRRALEGETGDADPRQSEQ